MQLRLAQVDAAVGVGRGAELQLEDEVLGELLLRREGLDATAFGGGRDHEPAVDGAVATVRAGGLSVELFLGLDLDELPLVEQPSDRVAN